MRGEAQQVGPLDPQVHNAFQDLLGVQRIVMISTLDVRRKHLPAEIPTFGILQEGDQER